MDKPYPQLLELLASQAAVLLYPSKNENDANLHDVETIIILDGTWQEAKKIYNKSSYLQNARAASLAATTSSRFALRRNQIVGGLCTLECIIELCKIKGLDELATTLAAAFEQFNRR